jgi:hypothetical protein
MRVPAARLVLVLVLDWRVGTRLLVETFSSVIVAVGGEQAGVSPDFDRTPVDVKLLGNLVQLEKTSGTQTSISIRERVGAPNLRDDVTVKRLASAGRQTSVVEQLGDLAFGVLIEKMIDGRDDVG